MNKFVFPDDLEPFKMLSGAEQLREMVEKQIVECQIRKDEPNIKFTVFYGEKKDLRMHVQCDICRKGLAWKRSDTSQPFLLRSFQNVHQHKLYTSSKQSAILEYLKSLPASTNFKKLQKQITAKYECSNSHFYGIIRKLKNPSTNLVIPSHCRLDLQKLKEAFSFQGNYYFSTIEPNYPSALLVIEPSMRELYQKYGYFIKIDTVDHFIKEQAKIEVIEDSGEISENWVPFIVGFISGCNSNGKIVIYGVFITMGLDTKAMKLVLEHFFAHMGSYCDTIISQQQQHIEMAIQELKQEGIFDGNHVLDFQSMLKFIKFNHHNTFKTIFEAYKASTVEQYENIMKPVLQQQQFKDSPPQSQQLQNFHKLSHKCCVSKIPPGFIGLPSSTGSLQRLYEFFKEQFARPNFYYDVALSVLNISHQINSRHIRRQLFREPIQKYASGEDAKQLKICRINICKSAFNIIVANYFKALKFSQKIRQQNKVTITNGHQNYEIIKDENGRWNCECEYFLKTHLPCEHELSCCTDFWVQVGVFWKYFEVESKNSVLRSEDQNQS